jgi:hypothetical protein
MIGEARTSDVPIRGESSNAVLRSDRPMRSVGQMTGARHRTSGAAATGERETVALSWIAE